MKKSWINKLIELLNEYDDWMVSWYEEYFPTEWLFVTNAGQWFREEFILGKRYWFIEWLVKNDKINFRKADADISKDIVLWREPDFADFMVYRRFADEEKVLMLLSISDNPISDLVSYLK